MYYLGIDVHKRDSQIAVLDESGELVAEQRLENDQFDDLAEAYAGSKAAFEATGNYYSIYDTLSEQLDVHVADPRQTKAIGTAEVKNDRLDAKLLAQLCRAGMVAESYVPPKDIRELRSLARGRKRLVEKRTDFKNEVHSLLDKYGIKYDWDPFSVKGREKLQSDNLDLSPVGRTLLDSFLAVIETLSEQIKELESIIEETAVSLEETQRLMTIPGVSFYSSVLIVGEIGEIDRFDRSAELVSYAGLDPVVRESGDSRTEGGISKEGSKPLRWILVQCANVAVNQVNDPYLGRFYARLKRKKNHQVAIVATARKLLVSIYHMLDRKEVYDPPGVTA
ncbi:IS110 family transposase [Halodesulfurarchaeum sp. HSR-GB]|uniref:IS110 family transposase n=1 Tax=Halodesulfurarchaeum sp. HSR-GB TaxID=3074077 RepID=UPI002863D664|nr:IS110 family transposase [Halodesulfurarchaeum sp. HSR-GB]MDR5657733.1 IS110 family transposase [Halodesulfurarchaeum sp. HSR-GB]